MSVRACVRACVRAYLCQNQIDDKLQGEEDVEDLVQGDEYALGVAAWRRIGADASRSCRVDADALSGAELKKRIGFGNSGGLHKNCGVAMYIPTESWELFSEDRNICGTTTCPRRGEAPSAARSGKNRKGWLRKQHIVAQYCDNISCTNL